MKPRMKNRLSSYRCWLVVCLLGLSLAVGSYAGYVYEYGNFHIVVEHNLFRSRQLDRAELIHYIKGYQVRTIVNLRGMNPGADWYQDEVMISKELGVVHHDFEMSANRDVSDETLKAILSTLRSSPKPILLHCRSGSDRTGLIAALYQYTVGGRSAEQAANQLSIWYGHVPYLGNSTAAMDRTFWRYVSSHDRQEVLLHDKRGAMSPFPAVGLNSA